jgi:nucleoside-diphosphate-sugar epimerase
MKVLVTGASGFVGSHLLRRLSGSEHQIVALRRSPIDAAATTPRFPNVEWVSADLVRCQEFPFVKDVSCVYHLAGASSVGDSPDVARLMKEVNLVATERLAHACRMHGVPRFVYVSSIAACEAADGTDVKEDNGWPVSEYGASKRRAEQALMAVHCREFAVTVLRPTALFGEFHKGSMYELAKVIRDGKLVLFGDGHNRTNFYYIGDFIETLLAVGNDDRSHGKVYVAADRPVRLRDLVSLVADAVGVADRVHCLPVAVGRGAGAICDALHWLFRVELPLSSRRVEAMVRDVGYCNDRLTKELGVVPAIGMRKGVMRSVAWYREAGLL